MAEANANAPAAGANGTGAPSTETEDTSELHRELTKRLKKFQAKQEKALEAKMAELFTKFDERLATIGPKDGEGASGAGKPGARAADEESPVVKGLQKQLAELHSKLEKSTQETAKEREQLKATKLRTDLTDQLVKLGLPADRARLALYQLVDGEKRVGWDEDGESIVFKDHDGDAVDLATGLKGWVKSDEAKIYLPPRGTQGSGDRPGGSAPKRGDGQQQVDKDAVGEGLLKVLFGDIAT